MNKKTNSHAWFIALVLLALPLLGACDAHITRNADGTMSVQTTISQGELQNAITASLADPLVKGVYVSLQAGYIDVTAQRQRLNDASKTDTLSFRLDLAAQSGHLVATVSNAALDGTPVERNRVDNWNQTIANRLERLGQRRPNTTLQSVAISPEAVTMDWQVTK